MTPANSTAVAKGPTTPAAPPLMRLASQADDPAVLADIYRENVNIAIWQRELPEQLLKEVKGFIATQPTFKSAMTVAPEHALQSISEAMGTIEACSLSKSIAELVDMFCCLIGVNRAGLRMGVLDAAMCPKFHVDRVPCRLVSTFAGGGTEWLHHNAVDRSKLGTGSRGLSDKDSGLMKSQRDIQQLSCGDVAILKGELWEGNEGAGLVHRSPAVAAGDARLLVTVDVSR